MSDMKTFDVSALTDPIPSGAVKAEASERLRGESGASAETRMTVGAVVRSVVLLIGAAVLAGLFVRLVQLLFGAYEFTPSTVVIALLMVVPLVVMRVRGLSQSRRDLDRGWYRLRRFAEANGLTHTIRISDPTHPAAVFTAGTDRVSSDVVRGSVPSALGGRAFEVGNHGFDTWAARARLPHELDYVMLPLRAPSPAFTIIDLSHARARPPWEPAAGQQPVALGDGFDERFETRCAPEAQDAVRAVLTPPVRAALTRLVAGAEVGVDLEVVEGSLYVVVRRSLPITDPTYWEWVEDLARLVDEQLDQRSDAAASLRVGEEDPQRAARRARLLGRVRGGRQVAVGCLLPLLFGAVAAAVSVMWR